MVFSVFGMSLFGVPICLSQYYYCPIPDSSLVAAAALLVRLHSELEGSSEFTANLIPPPLAFLYLCALAEGFFFKGMLLLATYTGLWSHNFFHLSL